MKTFKVLNYRVIGVLCFFVQLSFSQVGIGTTTPNADALLEINSTVATPGGVLLPRMALTMTTNPAPLSADVAGMIVYNTATAGDVTPGFYYNDGAVWVRLGGGKAVDNGLYYNGGSDTNRLGGALVENTTITQGAYAMTYNLTGTGNFRVQDNGTNSFAVLSNGRTTVGGLNNGGQFNVTGNSYFSDDIRLRDGAVNTGDILVRVYDSADDGIIDIYENNAYNIRLHGNGTTIFNEQGIATNDFRIESDTQNDMFFIDASTNRLGINTTTPTTQFQFVSDGAANWNSRWDNNSTAGAVGTMYQSSAANGNRVLLGVTNYSGSANVASALMGLSLNGTTIGSGGVGVLGHANNESGNGVQAEITFTGAYSGWSLYTNADVFTPGAVWTASDKRFKKEIAPIGSALDLLKKLDPVSYKFDTDKYPGIGFDEDRLTYGFIAQDLEKVIPELVKDKLIRLNSNEKKSANSTSSKDETAIFKVVNYTLMVPILTQAIKEQQSNIKKKGIEIEQLKAENKRLSSRIDRIELLLSK